MDSSNYVPMSPMSLGPFEIGGEFRTRLIEALRSGKYRKTTGRLCLRYTDGTFSFCVQGVIVDLLDPGHWYAAEQYSYMPGVEMMEYKGHRSAMPESMLSPTGMNALMAGFLMHLNDASGPFSCSFSDIAEFLEKDPRVVVTEVIPAPTNGLVVIDDVEGDELLLDESMYLAAVVMAAAVEEAVEPIAPAISFDHEIPAPVFASGEMPSPNFGADFHEDDEEDDLDDADDLDDSDDDEEDDEDLEDELI
jgi:hypothetical protein